jgi:DNA (cytosine-5)-methyltransferase 1
MENFKRLKSESDYKVVSLFSGIGGFDLGFIYNGFKVIWANDFDKYAVETYKKNVSENIIFGDLRLYIDQIPKSDVLLAGFPCQPFSTLGNLKGFDDEERGTLFFVIETIIKKTMPKIIVLENVKNLVNHDEGKTFSKMTEKLEKIGYRITYSILNTKDFGLPQNRNRVFVICLRDDLFNTALQFTFPDKIDLKIDLVNLLDKEVDGKYFLTNKISKTILSYGTKKFKARPSIDNKIAKTLTASMAKMHRASQDNYVTDNKNYSRQSLAGKINVRRLTPNECRKLQGFPNDWEQVSSDSQAYRQYGNAVTVNVSYYLAKQIKSLLDSI